jgi:hypothetical protein
MQPCLQQSLCSPFRFKYNNFWYAFLLSNNGLCMRILTFFVVENSFSLNVPHLLVVCDLVCVAIYLIHVETGIKRYTIAAYFKKLYFGPSQLYCPPLAQGKKTFLSP